MSDNLLAAHKALDHTCRNRGDKVFISDWYCDNPYWDRFIDTPLVEKFVKSERWMTDYYFQNDVSDVQELIRDFHKENMEPGYENQYPFVTCGVSPLITSTMSMIKRMGYKKVHIVKPLYYTYYFLAKTLDLELIPVNDSPLISKDVDDIKLPEGNPEVLIICDPIWFMGRSVSKANIEKIRAWQKSTNSLIFVDGAFQYQSWEATGGKAENTASFDPELTFRTICPTKTTAIHGPRFAYCLIPFKYKEEFRYNYANTAGSGSGLDLPLAISMMHGILNYEHNKIKDLVKNRYKILQKFGAIDDKFKSDCGYFVFVDIPVDKEKFITMDGPFFDFEKNTSSVRLNCLMRKEDMNSFLNTVVSDGGVDEGVVSAVMQTY